ncbi:hypothetical protein AGMMS50284_7290 [Clostridia bacterium]|nr:hypothetical protein AGMMS50284_7290 [Clostridia bacterium]
MSIINKINFTKTSLQKAKTQIQEYANTLTCVTEDFWEEHIAKANIYEITLLDKNIGIFSIHNINTEEKITMFYLEKSKINISQEIFKRILDEFKIKTAFVTTGDELFLSLCMDFHKKVKMQAYFFDGTIKNEVRPAEYGRECLVEATPDELPEINKKTDNFFEDLDMTTQVLGKQKFSVYKFIVDNTEVGYGVIGRNEFATKYWGTGMIALEQCRKKGVGRSIQIHLAKICRENGAIPVSGCWYYNELSKKTTESAGRYTKTRLLYVHFTEEQQN